MVNLEILPENNLPLYVAKYFIENYFLNNLCHRSAISRKVETGKKVLIWQHEVSKLGLSSFVKAIHSRKYPQLQRKHEYYENNREHAYLQRKHEYYDNKIILITSCSECKCTCFYQKIKGLQS